MAPEAPSGDAPSTSADEVQEAEVVEVVAARVGSRWFGFPAQDVHEVVIKGFVTRLPLSPAHIEGVTLIHGRLVTVIDLAALIPDVPPGPAGAMLPRLVLTGEEGAEIAVITDEAKGILEVTRVPTTVGDQGLEATPMLRGAAEWEGGLLTLVDGRALARAALAPTS